MVEGKRAASPSAQTVSTDIPALSDNHPEEDHQVAVLGAQMEDLFYARQRFSVPSLTFAGSCPVSASSVRKRRRFPSPRPRRCREDILPERLSGSEHPGRVG